MKKNFLLVFLLALLPMVGWAQATATLSNVAYDGSNTGLPTITAIDAGDIEDWIFLGLYQSRRAAVADLNGDQVGNEDKPNHVGTWYAAYTRQRGRTRTAVGSFQVTPAELKIDLLQIKKTYGEPDPVLPENGLLNGKPWASCNWRNGDDFSNSKIVDAVIDRNTAGEDAYDPETGSRYQYSYTLKDGYKVITTIDGVPYENYTAGIGQSSNLLIDKAKLTITIKEANRSKTFGDEDPDFTDGATYEPFTKDAEGNLLEETVKIYRTEGEHVNAEGYPFYADDKTQGNFDVTFISPAFMINPKSIGIDAVFADPAEYVYKGDAWEPVPTVTIKNSDPAVTLKNGTDFVVTWGGDNRNVTPAPTAAIPDPRPYATVKAKEGGDYTFDAVDAKFKIIPFELEFAIGDNFKYVGANDPYPLAEITFAQDKGLQGTDQMSDGEILIEQTIVKIGDLLTREEGESYGEYAITLAEGAAIPNYTIKSTTPGTFYIVRGQEIVVSFKSDPDKNSFSVTYEDEYDLKDLVVVTPPTDVEVGAELDDLLSFAQGKVAKGKMVNGVLTEDNSNDAGEYILYIKEPRPDVVGDYKIRYINGRFIINRLNLYIQPDAATKEYGDDDPDLTKWSLYKITGYTQTGAPIYTKYEKEVTVPQADLLGDDSDLLGYNFGYPIERESGETVGTYDMWFGVYGYNTQYGTKTQGNYIFQTITAPDAFSITKAKLTIDVAGNEKTYGDADPIVGDLQYINNTAFSFDKGYIAINISGVKGNSSYQRGFRALEMAGEVTYGKAVTNGIQYRAVGEDAGTYEIYNIACNITGENHNTIFDNYDVTFNENTDNDAYTINKRKLTVKINDQSPTYGNEINPYDLTIEGGHFTYTDGEPMDVNKKDLIVVKREVDGVEDTRGEIFNPLTLKEDVGENVGTFYENAFNDITLKEEAAKNYVIEKQENGFYYLKELKRIPLDPEALAAVLGVDESPTLLKEVLKAHDGRTVTFVLPKRKMAKDDWYAWVFPFELSQRDFFNDEVWGYGAIETLDVDKTTDQHVTFALNVTAPLKANTPFIVKIDTEIKADEMAEIEIPNKKVVYSENPVVGKEGCVQFVGLYETKDDFDMTTRVLRRIPTNDKPLEFWPGVGATLHETNAYLQFPTAESAAGARIYIEEPDGSVTAIQGVVKNNVENNAEGVYNLNGMKIQGAPAQKGVYIQNGKKVVIK